MKLHAITIRNQYLHLFRLEDANDIGNTIIHCPSPFSLELKRNFRKYQLGGPGVLVKNYKIPHLKDVRESDVF